MMVAWALWMVVHGGHRGAGSSCILNRVAERPEAAGARQAPGRPVRRADGRGEGARYSTGSRRGRCRSTSGRVSDVASRNDQDTCGPRDAVAAALVAFGRGARGRGRRAGGRAASRDIAEADALLRVIAERVPARRAVHAGHPGRARVGGTVAAAQRLGTSTFGVSRREPEAVARGVRSAADAPPLQGHAAALDVRRGAASCSTSTTATRRASGRRARTCSR